MAHPNGPYKIAKQRLFRSRGYRQAARWSPGQETLKRLSTGSVEAQMVYRIGTTHLTSTLAEPCRIMTRKNDFHDVKNRKLITCTSIIYATSGLSQANSTSPSNFETEKHENSAKQSHLWCFLQKIMHIQISTFPL